MCFCATPTRETDARRAPEMADADVLLYDEPGRCKPQVNGRGNTDYHSHHFRLVDRHGAYVLLVRHGGGDEAVTVGHRYTRVAELLAPMDSDARYLMLHALYKLHGDGQRAGHIETEAYWRKAARDKRIRTRKMPRSADVKVWIVPEVTKAVRS